jgi:hypothetical protein
MAALDIVSPRLRINSNPETLQPQPTHFGVVNAQDATSVTVIWDNLLVTALTGLAAIADANLDEIVNATAGTLSTFAGRWVRRISDPNNTAQDPSGGTQRDFDGKVIGAYGRTALDTGDPAVDFLLVVNDDGVYFEDVASRWVVDPNR